jgi:Tol biopolymer transport system component
MGDRFENASSPSANEAVRLQLAKITASQQFSGAPSLGRFLTFIVEETLNGRGAQIKEYLIGVDVFERGEAFDPRIDPIVRVQAGKLRKRLQDFYGRDGASDEIVIDLPKGSYLPLIRERTTIKPPQMAAADALSQKSSPPSARFWKAGAVAFGILTLASGALRFIPRADSRGPFQLALTRLTAHSGQTTHPAVSPDGKLLAFSSDRGPAGDSNIWVQPFTGGEALQLTQNPAADTSPDFSPDGSHLVFRSWRDGGGIYTVPVLGGRERRIADGGYSPRFSPDGKWVAFAQDGIQVVPAGGGDAIRLSGDVGGAACPLWSPDGQHLVFVGRAGDKYDWWVAPLGRDRSPRLTGVSADLRKSGLKDFDETTCPSAWSGSEVVFTLKVDGMGNLWKVPLSTKSWKADGGPTQLVPGPGVDHARVVQSSSGPVRLVFATDTNVSHLWSLPVEANRGEARGDIEQLTRDASLVSGLEGSRPVLSSNGNRLIFPSARSGNLDIWLKELSSGREESLTVDQRPEHQPVIDATGGRIAYQVSDGGRSAVYSLDMATRLPRKVCDDCDHPMDLSADGRYLLYRGREPWGLHLLELPSGKAVALFKDPAQFAMEATFSPDMNWIALVVRKGKTERLHAYLAPLSGHNLGATDTWIPITSEMYHLHLNWSPDGNRLYYFATRDDRRCLWSLRLDAATKRPNGEPVAVRHFHTVQHYPLSGSWISVARNRLAFNLTDVTSNIWMADSR